MAKHKRSHGGIRPGQRPPTGKTWRWPSTLAKEAARERVRQEITKHLPDLVAAQVANAQGLKYLVARDPQTGKFERIGPEGVRPDAVIEVWEKDPSVQAFSDLLNRAIDRPKEQVQEIEIRADNTTALDRAKERSLLKLKGDV
jgi:hypothetical protein